MSKKTHDPTRRNILGNFVPSGSEYLAGWLASRRRQLGYLSIFAVLPAATILQPQTVQATDPEKPRPRPSARIANITQTNCRTKPDLLKRQSDFRLPHQRQNPESLLLMAGTDDCPGQSVPAAHYTAAAPYVATGNTTGANNTVNQTRWYYYCYYAYNAGGPDHIYSFSLAGRGANPRISVTTTSPTYRPMIYILDGTVFGGCPAGTENQPCSMRLIATAPAPGMPVVFDAGAFDALPLNTPLHLFIDSPVAGPNDSGPFELRMEDVTIGPAQTGFDFDGDGRADINVFRPANNTWYLANSSGYSARPFGAAGDLLAPADFDGDRKTDIAIWRPSTGQWHLQTSGGTYQVIQWGESGDLPLPADRDGDGRAELIVFRPSTNTWYTRSIAGSLFTSRQFGEAGDRPVLGDFDNDRIADLAVFRPSNNTWYFQNAGGFSFKAFGAAGDIPAPADYDGDLTTDIGVFRPSTGLWYWIGSTEGYRVSNSWGIAGDMPVPADYDGDGKADIAVFRPSNNTWYIVGTTAGIISRPFGQAGDKPIPNTFIY
ncbi:MAG: VCBS repeat-containing protein [Acidobacteria bacterium]|nr:VCBS repeat-containing protein [Acidobacteriota bacterium]